MKKRRFTIFHQSGNPGNDEGETTKEFLNWSLQSKRIEFKDVETKQKTSHFKSFWKIILPEI